MHFDRLRRREFITLLGSAAAAWPLVASGQQGLPVIGFLGARTATDTVGLAAAFRQALNEAGFVYGRNVMIEYRWANNQPDQFSALAAELVGRPATVIAVFSTVGALATKGATTTIPIVFVTADDPVKVGMVASFARPGGNLTGITFVGATLGTKRLQLLRGLAPKTDLIAMLANPTSPESMNQAKDVADAARALGQQLAIVHASTAGEIDLAFARLAQHHTDALLLSGSPAFTTWRDQIVALAARYNIPTMYQFREFPAAGGLISYGASISDTYRQSGIYVGRILRGDKPADLPVLQPTRFELVINLKTAKGLGLEIPAMLLALADDVIE
jgi:ABC-type uncharacterized transport system substrate-binding protein